MRKISTKLLLCILFVVSVTCAFFAGGAVKERDYRDAQTARCNTLISFAKEKARSGALGDPNALKAMISNVYAASQSCPDSYVADELYDLWNTLLFRSDSFAGNEDSLVRLLNSYSGRLSADN